MRAAYVLNLGLVTDMRNFVDIFVAIRDRMPQTKAHVVATAMARTRGNAPPDPRPSRYVPKLIPLNPDSHARRERAQLRVICRPGFGTGPKFERQPGMVRYVEPVVIAGLLPYFPVEAPRSAKSEIGYMAPLPCVSRVMDDLAAFYGPLTRKQQVEAAFALGTVIYL